MHDNTGSLSFTIILHITLGRFLFPILLASLGRAFLSLPLEAFSNISVIFCKDAYTEPCMIQHTLYHFPYIVSLRMYAITELYIIFVVNTLPPASFFTFDKKHSGIKSQHQFFHRHGYICICSPGTTGVNCAASVNECISNPCKNNATCNDLSNGYNCSCLPGYTGMPTFVYDYVSNLNHSTLLALGLLVSFWDTL